MGNILYLNQKIQINNILENLKRENGNLVINFLSKLIRLAKSLFIRLWNNDPIMRYSA